MVPEAFIFDFDGLILDTETVEYKIWRTLLATYGVDLLIEDWRRCVGASFAAFHPLDYLESKLGHALPERSSLQISAADRALEETKRTPAQPGVIEFIKAASENQMKLAVASSSPRQWVMGHLENLGLVQYFSFVCTAEDVSRVKPAPDLYLLAVTKLNVNPGACIAFEDSTNGLTAAKDAGLTCVVVPNGITKFMDFSRADWCYQSFEDIPYNAFLTTLQ